MTPKEYLTLLVGYAGTDKITANVINTVNNKIIAKQIYARTIGARTVPKKDGTPYEFGDVVKVVTPLIPTLIDTKTLVEEELKGSVWKKKAIKNWVKQFQIDTDKSLDFDYLDTVEVAGLGGVTKYTLLLQVTYLLKWADFFNQEFIRVLVDSAIVKAKADATHYQKLSGSETDEEFFDIILDTVAKIKNIYNGQGLSLNDSDIIIYLNTKASHKITKFVKISTGNNNGASSTGFTPLNSSALVYNYTVDDRLNKFFGDTTTATATYDPTKPLFIVDIAGAVAQEVNVITAFRLREGETEGTYRTGGRAVLGTHRMAPSSYVFAGSVTALANIDLSKFSTNSLGQGQSTQTDTPQTDAQSQFLNDGDIIGKDTIEITLQGDK